VVGGRRAVAEALRSGKAKRVLAVSGSHDTEGMRAVTEAARRGSVAIEWVGREAIEGLGVPDHQGVAAFVHPPEELDDRALAAFAFSEGAIVVVLDGIMDPQNFGASARSAEAAGASLLMTRERRAAPVTPAAVRASAGALLHLPLARVTNLTRALERLRDRGFFVVGLDHRADHSIDQAPVPPRPLALVIGAEGAGISRLVRETCDQLVSIPMAGRVDSLNASAALAVALFAYALRAPEA
jgi:23S rRNA (guanosine2251-2'-O)-methyltransferase